MVNLSVDLFQRQKRRTVDSPFDLINSHRPLLPLLPLVLKLLQPLMVKLNMINRAMLRLLLVKVHPSVDLRRDYLQGKERKLKLPLLLRWPLNRVTDNMEIWSLPFPPYLRFIDKHPHILLLEQSCLDHSLRPCQADTTFHLNITTKVPRTLLSDTPTDRAIIKGDIMPLHLDKGILTINI